MIYKIDLQVIFLLVFLKFMKHILFLFSITCFEFDLFKSIEVLTLNSGSCLNTLRIIEPDVAIIVLQEFGFHLKDLLFH